MIDIHTHILPDCDDGSPDIETSIKNLKMMQDAGVTDVLLTPHFLRNLYHNSADIIENRFDLLQKTILKENLTINPHKAAEVYLDSKIIADIEKENLFIEVLGSLQNAGALDYLILIGSWCQYLYNLYFSNPIEISEIRTLDLDFLIPSRDKIKKDINISDVLKTLDFVPIINYPSGLIKFEHPD